MVKINLNSAELSRILNLIDESGCFNEDFLNVVDLNIVNKINGVANGHNRAMEDYAIELRNIMGGDQEDE